MNEIVPSYHIIIIILVDGKSVYNRVCTYLLNTTLYYTEVTKNKRFADGASFMFLKV